jgi:FkbM family methyltransferase
MSKLTLVDVGARGGISSRWNPYLEHIQLIAFEPDVTECEALNSRKSAYASRYLPVALGAHDGELATLYMMSKPGCSSLLRPDPEIVKRFSYARNSMVITSEKALTLSRLDTVATQYGFSPDVLKIDTQGTELDVLKGAGTLLENTLVVELEVEFIPQYVNQPLFADIDTFMRGNGFQLRGLRRTYWRDDHNSCSAMGGQIVHGDALYIRTVASEKMFIALAAYGQHDLLCSLLEKTGKMEQYAWLLPRKSLSSSLLRRCFGRFTNRSLRKAVDTLRPINANDWHDPDFY